MSSRKSVVTDTSSSIRKAKSDTDIAMQSLKKKAEVGLLGLKLLVYACTMVEHVSSEMNLPLAMY